MSVVSDKALASRSTGALRFCVLFAIAALSVVALFHVWIPLPKNRALPHFSADTAEDPVPVFQRNRFWAPELQRLKSWGSFLDTAAYTGTHVSAWYRTSPKVGLRLCGYPVSPGNSVFVEIRKRDGALRRIAYQGQNPGENWEVWRFDTESEEEALRIVATDGTTDKSGWLGFAEPAIASRWPTLHGRDVLMLLSTVALSLVLVIGPGVLLSLGRRNDLLHVVWVGPALLLVGGLVTWSLGGKFAPSTIATTWAATTLAAIFAVALRRRIWRLGSRAEWLIMAIMSLCAVGATAKATFSYGPSRELLAGTVSRTLEVGWHSDSRIPFHVVQLVAGHYGPSHPQSHSYFGGWGFSARGPVAGLAVTPIVLATGGRPPEEMPDQPWRPFDAQGFAAFRIGMIVLATLALAAVHTLTRHIGGEAKSTLVVAIVALSPFFWHELYFTWPKMLAATWVLTGFFLALNRRPIIAGIAVGFAYLAHPSALISAPFVALRVLTARERGQRMRFGAATLFCGVIFAYLMGWRWINADNYRQADFLRYALEADSVYLPPILDWLRARWLNLADTLIPLYVLVVNSDHPSYNALGSTSGPIVRFCLQYWVAWPFAIGFITWCCLLRAIVSSVRRHWRVGAAFVWGPLVLLGIYWGGATTGLMREAGHVFFLASLIFIVWAAADRLPSFVAGSVFLALRGVEVFFAILAPSLESFAVNYGRPEIQLFRQSDILWLNVSALCVAGTVVTVHRFQRDRSVTPAPALD